MCDDADAVLIQYVQHLLVVPTFVTEFDDLLEVSREAGEECIQPLGVLLQVRRELVEQGA